MDASGQPAAARARPEPPQAIRAAYCTNSEGPEIHLSDWQSWIADGIGRIHQGVLCIAGPQITLDEWAARFVTEH